MGSVDEDIKQVVISNMTEFPYAGISISFLTKDSYSTPFILEKCLNNISIEDLELLYIYEIDTIPELVANVKARGADKELIRKVFGKEKNELREKEQLKL